MNRFKTFIMVLVVFSFASCQSSKLFYFNDKMITEHIVYKFINEEDEQDIIYWEMFFTTNDTLVTNTYDSKLFLQNEFKEVLEKSNSKLTEYTSFFEFHNEPVKAHISNDNVFDWSTNEQIEYKVDFQVKQDKISISKQRKFLATESKKYKGKSIKTKKFKDTYLITVNSIMHEPTYNITYYAKGIGVIQFNSHIQGNISKMKLNAILTKNEFEKLKTYR